MAQQRDLKHPSRGTEGRQQDKRVAALHFFQPELGRGVGLHLQRHNSAVHSRKGV